VFPESAQKYLKPFLPFIDRQRNCFPRNQRVIVAGVKIGDEKEWPEKRRLMSENKGWLLLMKLTEADEAIQSLSSDSKNIESKFTTR
jgi:hypothetical protein